MWEPSLVPSCLFTDCSNVALAAEQEVTVVVFNWFSWRTWVHFKVTTVSLLMVAICTEVCAVTGFTGTQCEIDIDECQLNPCLNGGICNDLINTFRCVCAIGFTGNRCQINIDDCESNPCRNGGICHDSIAVYTCECPPGFTGQCRTCLETYAPSFDEVWYGITVYWQICFNVLRCLSSFMASLWEVTGGENVHWHNV